VRSAVSRSRATAYISLIVRSLDDLIEYELDDDDEEFLHALNTVLKLKDAPSKPVMADDDLEAVLNYFEIESFYQRDPSSILSKNAPFSGLYNESNDAETPCAVCGDPDFSGGNLIVYCDGCDMAVHVTCYLVRALPAGSWLCRRCSLRGRRVAVRAQRQAQIVRCDRHGVGSGEMQSVSQQGRRAAAVRGRHRLGARTRVRVCVRACAH
jgi:hypothetical protein